jgi:MFS family permease
MPFQPSETLQSRTYLGLILAQFLAAFNDQAIHASSMFYAIHQDVLTEKAAIALMPILFYAPWAIFCTLAGYLADRFSKRDSLVFWKVAEIGITLVALTGFCLGSLWHGRLGGINIGPWIVLSTVFLMGTHSAFFVPAKYGVMPEILQPQLLSRGNGVLECTSFLAVILGTVSGGILSFVFHGAEYWIGAILVVLALIGAAASLLIQRMPAANPHRPFPTNLVRPLLENLRTMLRSRPLALAVLGIAFFTFMVAFMRSTMYMHGESSVPRWNEFKTSLVVATVALGVGLGSYLAGILSGGKVELGLVPLGSVGMIATTLVAAFTLFWLPGLVATLIALGFFSGFYIVPLYTLLQHRAPKASKGDLIATSNFINVTGAIIASLFFYLLVFVAEKTGLAPQLYPTDQIAAGELTRLEYRRGRPSFFAVGDLEVGRPRLTPTGKPNEPDEEEPDEHRIHVEATGPIEVGSGLQPAGPDKPGSQVTVSTYTLRGVTHWKVRPADQPLKPVYDQEQLPRYLFAGASLLTLGILVLLCRQLPDFFVRSLLWLRSHGRFRIKATGIQHLPSEGPAILATNCDGFEMCMQVVAATDRFTRSILVERAQEWRPPLLRYLARRTGLLTLPANALTKEACAGALDRATRSLAEGSLVAVTADGAGPAPEIVELLQNLRRRTAAPVIPVYCGTDAMHRSHWGRWVQVVIGQPLPADANADAICQAIHALGDGLKQSEPAEQPASAL